MRILHLDSGKSFRGGQRQALALARGLQQESLLLTPAGGPMMAAAQVCGIAVEPLTFTSMMQRSRGASIVHAHDARSHTWAAALGLTPLVVSRRVEFDIRRSLPSRWKYSRARSYIAVSEHVRAKLIAGGVPADKVTVVYDGVDIPEKPAAGGLIVAPASHDPLKANDLLREAASIAGCTVHFSEDLTADLPSAALFVYITRSEGLGSAALKAMAAGIPVVASRVGGLPEIVVDGVTGLLTENNPQAIARAICQALDARESLSANCRPHVESRFTTAHMVDGTRHVYRKALEC